MVQVCTVDNGTHSVDEKSILKLCSGAANRGRLRLTNHAIERMEERNATIDDIESAVSSATSATHDTERGTWKLTGGSDVDGDTLTVCVAVNGEILVVSIF